MSAVDLLYAKLVALKNSLPESERVDAKWVNEFHSIVAALEGQCRDDLSECRVPPSEMTRLQTPILVQYLPTDEREARENFYESTLFCDRHSLLMKIDTLLGWFTLRKRYDIGFKPPGT